MISDDIKCHETKYIRPNSETPGYTICNHFWPFSPILPADVLVTQGTGTSADIIETGLL